MTILTRLQRYAQLAAGVSALLAGAATLVSAHSIEDCAWDVSEFCGSDQACRQSGIHACWTHRHPGGSVPPAPDPQGTFDSDPGWELKEKGPALQAKPK